MAPDQGQNDSFHHLAEECATNVPSQTVDAEHRLTVDAALQECAKSAFGRRAWLDLG